MTPSTATPPDVATKRVLEPSERIAEVLFGLIMVLTFTGSLSVADAGREDVRAMLVGALGCNIAWGIIDAILYLMACLAEKSRDRATLVAIREARDPRQAHALIAGVIPATIASVVQPAEFEALRQRLTQLPEPTGRVRLEGSDWRGGLAVLVLVFVSTLPVAVPFMFMRDAMAALRVSNTVAVVMLFGAGIAYGRAVGRSPWLLGVGMVGLGAALVALTMALGG